MYHLYLFISIFKYKTKDKGGGVEQLSIEC